MAGRPPEGTRVETRLSDDLLEWVDDLVKGSGTTRAKVLRNLISAAREAHAYQA